MHRRVTAGYGPTPSAIYSFFLSPTGMYLQITARVDPVTAIHTTDTAGGTRARKGAKWSLARRKPKAEDFMAVSMAMVLLGQPRARGKKKG